MKRIALFPGSFDPFTLGHAALVETALKLCDEVVIAVGENISKSHFLSVTERCRLISDIYANEPRVRVESFGVLTGEFAHQVGATILVRGVRNTTDFNFEHTIEATNRRLFPELTTVLLVTPSEYAHISSSVVRELHAFGHPLEGFLPEGVDLKKYIK